MLKLLEFAGMVGGYLLIGFACYPMCRRFVERHTEIKSSPALGAFFWPSTLLAISLHRLDAAIQGRKLHG